ncbi:hypothetical protein F5884DRAFT_747498 [Xylogone sp. PMI_703]|nr:hypothetical protein F5884DRAFT_747498 [Xylogone sp. PMI_703]
MPALTNALANHIAISVSDAEAAVKWSPEWIHTEAEYAMLNRDGLRKISKLTVVVYGLELEEMKLALLSTGNGVGVEIFEFINPPYNGPHEPAKFGPGIYARGGFFHVCFTVPDVTVTTDNAVRLGGKLLRWAVTANPWGNILEFLPVSWEQLWLEFFS